MSLYLLLASAYGLAAAAMPGPLAAFLVSHTLAHGGRRTAPAALSPVLSDGPIALLVLLLLSQVPSSFVQALRLVGGMFLLYLAFETTRAYRSFDLQERPDPPPARSSLFKATLVNLLNPNPYLGWSLVLGPLLLEGWAVSPWQGLAVLVGFYGTMVATLLAMIAITATAGRAERRFQRGLLGLSALGLAGFGGYQLWLAFSALQLA